MNIRINNTNIDITLKKDLEMVINEYHEANSKLEAAYRAANAKFKADSKDNVYTDDYLVKDLNVALTAAKAVFAAKSERLNEMTKKNIAKLRKQLVPALSSFNRPSDYAVRINNALQFIQVEGPEIDDATAFQILHDFKNDVETMQRFRSVIEHQKGKMLSDAYGRTTFPLTFGRLERCEQFFKAFSELESTADNLFIRKKAETETEYTANGVKLFVPMDGYMQIISESNAAEQAETLEAMAEELFATTE